MPRGKALGAAWYLPEERQLTTKEQLLDEMCATLGGRASEDLTFGKISTGALNDLERTNKQAYAMIAYYGMSDKLQNLCYYDSSGQSAYSFSKPYSEETAKLIDDEVKKLIAEQYERAKAILTEHKEGLAELAKILIEREVIFADDLEKIFGKRPWASRTEELMEANAKSKEAEKEDMEEETEKPLSAENGETEKSADETNESVAEKEKQDNGAENDLN